VPAPARIAEGAADAAVAVAAALEGRTPAARAPALEGLAPAARAPAAESRASAPRAPSQAPAPTQAQARPGARARSPLPPHTRPPLLQGPALLPPAPALRRQPAGGAPAPSHAARASQPLVGGSQSHAARASQALSASSPEEAPAPAGRRLSYSAAAPLGRVGSYSGAAQLSASPAATDGAAAAAAGRSGGVDAGADSGSPTMASRQLSAAQQAPFGLAQARAADAAGRRAARFVLEETSPQAQRLAAAGVAGGRRGDTGGEGASLPPAGPGAAAAELEEEGADDFDALFSNAGHAVAPGLGPSHEVQMYLRQTYARDYGVVPPQPPLLPLWALPGSGGAASAGLPAGRTEEASAPPPLRHADPHSAVGATSEPLLGAQAYDGDHSEFPLGQGE